MKDLLRLSVIFLSISFSLEQPGFADNATNSYMTEETSDTLSTPTTKTSQHLNSANKDGAKIKALKDAAVNIDKWGGLLLLVLSSVGNSLTLIVLCKKSMRQYAVNITLIVMTTFDLLHIIFGQVGRHALRGFRGSDPTYESNAYCKLWYVLVSSTVIYSTYILAGISVFRSIAMAVPLKARTLLSAKTTKQFTLVCAVFVVVIISHVPVSYGHVTFPNGAAVCTAYVTAKTAAGTYYYSKIRPWQDFVNSTLLPMVMLVVSNIVTISCLIKRKRDVKKLTGFEPKGEQQQNRATASSPENALVGLLVAISITFIVLKTPVMIMYLRTLTFVQINAGLTGAYNTLAWSLSLFFNYLYHTANFFLYNISSREFRTEFMKTIKCGQRDKPRAGAGLGSRIGDSVEGPSMSGSQTEVTAITKI